MAEVRVTADVGTWLVEHRSEMDRGEAAWLERLAEFDLAEGWAADGHLTCAHWLMWHTKMARATAYEKLAIAHELRRRPVVAEAFAAGRLSYSAVRTITRIEGPDRDVDVALVNLAESGTVADVERAVRFYQLHADQYRRPPELTPEPILRRRPNLDGTTTIEVTLEDSEAEELWSIIRAFADHPTAVSQVVASENADGGGDESARADDAAAGADGATEILEDPESCDKGAVEESAAADSDAGGGCAHELIPIAGALLDMARLALAHIGEPSVAGQDRYMVHVVVREGHAELLAGSPLPPAIACRLACDSSSVTHLIGKKGELLALGRKTKQWSRAQRRAIMVRDGGRCRFPGCGYRVTDVHHHRWWTRGGSTDVSNGWLACTRHHTLVHDGVVVVTGEPNGILSFRRQDGSLVGSTGPLSPIFGLAA